MASSNFLTSSVGKKVIMGATGFFLISFLIIHVSINSLIFLDILNPDENGVAFNGGAHFMSHNWVIRVIEVGLFVGLLLHTVQGVRLTIENRSKRPVKYAMYDGNANSKWYSRSMGLLGSLILMFLVVHLANFWYPTKVALLSGEEHDTFKNIVEVFQNPIFVIIYLLGVGSLCFHLMHGFQSAFRTFGLVHKKYTPMIISIGVGFSIVVCTLFALMPILVFAGIIS
ncbi:MAG: succinate dehydrogenase cytochrome b subunit [Chitinophagales bacterium]|nr:succinate dehydrogenase cytochrome b subunit [Chitinophagales bacterium]MCZ2393701.1 succinate dehydrogenase cytochrome b subunit [Chitinophagales bacterium]